MLIGDDHTEQILTEKIGAIRSFAWSPDGHSLAFIGHETAQSQWGLYVLSDNAPVFVNTLLRSSNDLFSLAWSPDNRYLAVETGLEPSQSHLSDFGVPRGIMIVATDGSVKRLISRDIPVRGQASWSFDSGRVFFLPDPLFYSGRVFVADLDGTEPTLIHVEPLADPDISPLFMHLCPGGDFALLEQVSTQQAAGFRQLLYVQQLQGDLRTQLPTIDGQKLLVAVWSPGSTYIALVTTPFGANDENSGDLYVVSADGSELRQLASDVDVTSVSWRPEASP